MPAKGKTPPPVPGENGASRKKTPCGNSTGGSGLALHPAADFLQLLGKDPAQTYFRTLQRGTNPNRSRSGRDLKGFDPEALDHDNASQSIYFVSGNATGASGINKRTGKPTHAVIDDDCPTCTALFVEWDDKPIEWQLQAWQELGLPEPSAMVATGGKSIHCYWILSEPLGSAEWRQIQARLITHCGGDEQCKNPARLMRLPGFAYIDKTTGKPSGQVAEVIHTSGTRYRPDQIAYYLPAVEAPAPAPGPSTKAKAKASTKATNLPPRPLEQIKAAAQFIPKRVVGGNTYEECRNALCGCAAALSAIGEPDEMALELLAHKWPDWTTAEQVLASTTTREAASFWAIAQAHGLELRRSERSIPPHPHEAPHEQQQSAGKQQQSTIRRSWEDRNRRKLSHSRAMECMERCIEVQAKGERNSLRRRARLSKAAHDLQLQRYIKAQDIAQRVLEAKDGAAGNTFRALSAADRAAMPKPVLRWLLPGLIPANDMTIIGGRPKVGKTRLAVAIAAAVLRGESVLDLPPPSEARPVVLVTDDQSDGDSADMLEAVGMWNHPRLFWSKSFRLTEENIDALLDAIKANPGALVIIDSLRSIGRSLQHGENDPEIGAVLYDLKQAVMDAGGTLLLIHHCNKAMDLVGVEALSGHNAISGAANTVLTMHYLPGVNNQPNKAIPDRRLVREGRSGEGFDLVITRDGSSFRKVGGMDEWQQQAQQAQKLEKLMPLQQQALDALKESGEWLTRRQVCEAVGVKWTERGRQGKPRQVGDALTRLVELRAAESTRAGTEATYRTTCGAQETTVTTVPISDAKGSQCHGADRDNRDNDEPPEGWHGCHETGRDTESAGPDSVARLSRLSRPPRALEAQPELLPISPALIGPGADAMDDDDDPHWGPRRSAA